MKTVLRDAKKMFLEWHYKCKCFTIEDLSLIFTLRKVGACGLENDVFNSASLLHKKFFEGDTPCNSFCYDVCLRLY